MANQTNINAYYKDIILNNVNLHGGYSLSNNWIGYFERNKKFKMKYLREATDFFKDFFKVEMKNIIIATSLYIDADSLKKNKYIDIEKRLCGEDYIKMISGNTVFDDNSAIYNQQAHDIESSFRILFPEKEDVFEQLSILTMADDNVRGRCFFILERSNLIVYPHEDTGYGFIGLRGRNNMAGFDFLRKMAEKSNFNSYIYDDKR